MKEVGQIVVDCRLPVSVTLRSAEAEGGFRQSNGWFDVPGRPASQRQVIKSGDSGAGIT